MAWITITESDVQTRLAGAELTALKSAALATGQTSPLSDIIAHVVDEMRGYIAACAANTLGQAGTIPAKLLSAALAMIRYRLATRLPVKSLLTEDRVKENEAAIRLLEQVAACKFAIEEPATPDTTETISSPTPRLTARTRQFGRDYEDGV
jgi:phage gp36-like protein